MRLQEPPPWIPVVPGRMWESSVCSGDREADPEVSWGCDVSTQQAAVGGFLPHLGEKCTQTLSALSAQALKGTRVVMYGLVLVHDRGFHLGSQACFPLCEEVLVSAPEGSPRGPHPCSADVPAPRGSWAPGRGLRGPGAMDENV